MQPDDPPPKTYGFKEREFKRDNATGSADATPTAKELAKMAGPVVKSPKGATGPKADDPNDVYAVLQKNRGLEKQLRGDQIEILEIKSKRKRDYWLLLGVGNLIIVGIAAVMGLNVMTVSFACVGVLVYSTSLTWIMWQIMGRY
jgi:hypothetical protein